MRIPGPVRGAEASTRGRHAEQAPPRHGSE